MIDWLFSSASERRLLGGTRLSGPTPWVIAIMSFSMMIVAAAGLALARTAGLVAQSAEHRYSLQIPGGGSDLGRALAALRTVPGVSGVDAVPEDRMRQTLEQWLGPEAGSDDLPIPALIHFDLRPGVEVRTVLERARSAAPSARVVAHSQTLGPLRNSLRAMQWLALGLVVLLAAATAAAVVLAARGALDTHRFTIDVMHGIGATDVQITRLFQRKIAIDSLTGSLAGAALAALVLVLLAGGVGLAGDLAPSAVFGRADLALLALLPVALAILATAVARWAVLATLRRSL